MQEGQEYLGIKILPSFHSKKKKKSHVCIHWMGKEEKVCLPFWLLCTDWVVRELSTIVYELQIVQKHGNTTMNIE